MSGEYLDIGKKESKMETAREVRLVRYNPHHDEGLTDGLIECYREVFGEEPWNEWKKCSVCGKKWGKQEMPQADGVFSHCGQRVVDFWPTEVVRSDLLHEITVDASCRLALEGERVVGFCWGYPISPEELGKKLEIGGLANALTRMFGELQVVAYQDELGVLKEFRGQKLAKDLFRRRLDDFRERGFDVGVIRTKTNPPSVTYLWFTKKLGYQLVAEYNDADGRVVLARSLVDLRVE